MSIDAEPAKGKDTSWFYELMFNQGSDYQPTPAQVNPDARGRMASASAAFLALALVGASLSAVAVRFAEGEPQVTATRNELSARVAALADRADAWNASNAALRTGNRRLEDLVLPDLDGQLAKSIKAERSYGGYQTLSGAGLLVVVENLRGGQSATDWTIDTDLQVLVNGLFAAGAKGVAVNGIRVTAATSIRGAGGNILVDYQPVSSPYRVTAVGKSLRAKLTKLPAQAWLDDLATNYAVSVSYFNRSKIVLPAGTIPTVQYAQEVNQ